MKMPAGAGTLLLGLILFISLPVFSQERQKEVLPEKTIILTFDDGPRPWIFPQILDFLKGERLRATFFVQGWQAEKYPHLIRRGHKEGHGFGNHTYGHGRFDLMREKYGKEWVVKDIEHCSDVLINLLGYRPRFLRPPHWVIDEKFAMELRSGIYFDEKTGEAVEREIFIVQELDKSSLSSGARVFRDVNSTDYEFHKWHRRDSKAATAALVKRVENILKKREQEGVFTHILVFHELAVSLEALKILVPQWHSEGYQFRTLNWVYEP